MGDCSYLLMLCCVTALQMSHLHSQQQTPAELASKLLEASCRGRNFTAFYLHIREKQGMTRRYPPWPNSKVANKAISGGGDKDPLLYMCMHAKDLTYMHV